MGAMCEICENRKDLELYIHIPFCIKKCNYCDFLSFPSSAEDREEYVRCLVKEIEQTGIVLNNKDTYQVRSVFIGGGTPSLLSGDQIKNIMQVVQKYFLIKEEAEITMEANPGTLTKKNLSAYKDAGINRLSMGLQSADNSCLYLLGRIHTWEEFLKNYELARKAGFENINIDLMSGLPGQTMSIYKKTLEKVMALRPEHISAYSLILEEGTPFYESEEIHKKIPNEEADREMYQFTKEILAENGYDRYEISNYAKENKECFHNKIYWECKEYIGLGVSSSSYINGKRIKNIDSINEYINNINENKSVIEEELENTEKDNIEEFMFMGLRMIKGIEEKEFEIRFKKKVDEVYKEVIEKHIKNSLVIRENGRIFLTKKGIELSNIVMSDMILE